jgi:hypothetical protein
MQTNETPFYDTSDNPTDCCPRFKPEGWDGQHLHFQAKPFVRAKTRSLMHVPVNMGSVFARTYGAIAATGAAEPSRTLVLSRDLSPWSAEHLFAVTGDVPGERTVWLTGDYRTKVFEGSYRELPKWGEAFEDELEGQGLDVEETYFFYTTCPRCAKAYGKNYVVAVAKVHPDRD